MRTIHRWVMSVFSLLLLYWIGSGLVLAVYDLTDSSMAFAREGGGAGAPAPRRIFGLSIQDAAPLGEAQIRDMVFAATAAAKHAAPGESVTSMELHIEHGQPRANVGLGLESPHRLIVNTDTGAVLSPVPDASRIATGTGNLHSPIKIWHRGLAFGVGGAILSFTSGCALLILLVTGAYMYAGMWRARVRSGRGAIFWR